MNERLIVEFVSPQWLREKNACKKHVQIVETEWPEGVKLTKASIRRAGELGLDLHWLAIQVIRRGYPWEEYEREMEVDSKLEGGKHKRAEAFIKGANLD